ncbi:MAG TPA: ATP-binding cassette domain-containing protein [Thermoanaerobaculia bacterium]|nr:ATP-binding cassette domain-containing protein [Thermoanaerobaculia bacterium]
MTPSLELRDVRKSFGDFTAVDGLSLAVPPGVIFGLLGPNGAGKTTTIRMIMDIIAPDAGEVLLFGRSRHAADLRRIGYLPEERGLYRKMTVVDQLVFLGELRGLKRRQALPVIERWLARVELAAWGRKKIEELSKGMQQKVQLIGTVLHEPEILILDEPFSGLDPLNQGLFKELLAEYRGQGKTILFSTHGMEQAEKLCDHIGLISHGRLVLAGELREIKRRLGGNSYRLVAEGDLARLPAVPGVEQAVVQNGAVKLLLRPGIDGAAVLREIVQFLAVREFRSEEPDLEEIFIKAVRDAA